MTDSSPGFGGVKSPCASSAVEEKLLRAGEYFEDCLKIIFRVAEADELGRSVEYAIFKDFARCWALESANVFWQH